MQIIYLLPDISQDKAVLVAEMIRGPNPARD